MLKLLYNKSKTIGKFFKETPEKIHTIYNKEPNES